VVGGGLVSWRLLEQSRCQMDGKQRVNKRVFARINPNFANSASVGGFVFELWEFNCKKYDTKLFVMYTCACNQLWGERAF